MNPPTYAITVFLDNWAATEETLLCLGEQGATRVLAINNGSSAETEARFAGYCSGHPEVLPWRHNPPLPSLAATWNAALRFAWGAGAEEALVTNNDVKIHRDTLRVLSAARQSICINDALTHPMFISAVNAGEVPAEETLKMPNLTSWGGPDFSCYLVTREGHERYPFDEGFIPAYGEDCDLHRRYMLGGDGQRIFSIALPYEHVGGGSGTLKSMTPERRQATDEQIARVSRVHYAKKWGGPVNEEKWVLPYGVAQDLKCKHEKGIRCFGCQRCEKGCVTNPELQAHGCGGRA